MNYGQALEAMKREATVSRVSAPDAVVYIAHPGTPLAYFEKNTPDGAVPYQPSFSDQLADDWQVAA